MVTRNLGFHEFLDGRIRVETGSRRVRPAELLSTNNSLNLNPIVVEQQFFVLSVVYLGTLVPMYLRSYLFC